MKVVIVLLILNLSVLTYGIKAKYWHFSENDYIKKEVLEMTTPFSVKIDTEFLKNLKPAYEQ